MPLFIPPEQGDLMSLQMSALPPASHLIPPPISAQLYPLKLRYVAELRTDRTTGGGWNSRISNCWNPPIAGCHAGSRTVIATRAAATHVLNIPEICCMASAITASIDDDLQSSAPGLQHRRGSIATIQSGMENQFLMPATFDSSRSGGTIHNQLSVPHVRNLQRPILPSCT